MQHVLFPSTSHMLYTILSLAISLVSGPQLNSCLSPVIFIHPSLDYAFTSPNRIIPSYRKQVPSSKALQCLCTTQLNLLSWKEAIHPYSLCKLSLSLTVAATTVHLMQQLPFNLTAYHLKKKDYILDGEQLFNKYKKAIKKGKSEIEFSWCLALLLPSCSLS